MVLGKFGVAITSFQECGTRFRGGGEKRIIEVLVIGHSASVDLIGTFHGHLCVHKLCTVKSVEVPYPYLLAQMITELLFGFHFGSA